MHGNQTILSTFNSCLNLLSNVAMYPGKDNEFITPELLQTYMKALPELIYIVKHTRIMVIDRYKNILPPKETT